LPGLCTVANASPQNYHPCKLSSSVSRQSLAVQCRGVTAITASRDASCRRIRVRVINREVAEKFRSVVSTVFVAILRPSQRRRGGRVAEGARLESVYTGNRIVGSNPTPSAIPAFILPSQNQRGPLSLAVIDSANRFLTITAAPLSPKATFRGLDYGRLL
jgi:hypothetical protein